MTDDAPALVLAELARKLSVKKLLAEFPELTSEKLRKILEEASRTAPRTESARPTKTVKAKPTPRKNQGDGGKWIIYVDGGSRGNPGLAGAGALLIGGDERIELNKPLGIATNNVAEYEALIMALEEAHRQNANNIEVRSDSELMVRQMNGIYQVKSPHLKPLFKKASKLASSFKEVKLIHIDRSKNKEADRLANIAMDTAI